MGSDGILMVLDIIMESKKRWLRAQKLKMPFRVIAPLALDYANTHKTHDFISAVKNGKTGVIPQIIRALPTGEVYRNPFDAFQIAVGLQEAGAESLCFFTEQHYFKGDEQWIKQCRNKVSLPIMHGDFIFSKWQICQSRLLGADAVCLIAAVLDLFGLKNFMGAAELMGMQSMVLVSTEEELKRALQAGAEMIGVLNRSIATLDVDFRATERLRGLIPEEITTISVGGVETAQDVRRLRSMGYDAVMVSKALMTSSAPGEKLRELMI